MKQVTQVLAVLLLFLLSACQQDSKTNSKENDATKEHVTESNTDTPLFSLLPSAQTGITFRNDLVEDVNDETKNILSFDYFFNGAGVAIGDINNDGLPDVFMVGNEVNNRLYLNKGNMQFEDITDKANVNTNKHWSTGATMADVNGDGNIDIYVSQGGQETYPGK